ncbi:uncharacterized protein LOC144097173 [Amblyomma americanum]
MKNSAIVLALLLLSAVMVAEAQQFGGGFPGRGGFRCGRQICRRGQRCIQVPVRCFRPPCRRFFRCV